MAGLGVVICNHEGLVMASLSEVIQQPPTVIGMESFCSGYRFCLTQIKKNSKNIQFKKKNHSGFISSQIRSGQIEKEKKKSFQVPFLPNLGWSIPKKIQNKYKKIKKIKKTLFWFQF